MTPTMSSGSSSPVDTVKADFDPGQPTLEVENGSIDVVFERKTMRRIDLRMLPLLGLLYAIALIDRTNLGVARVVGMGPQLGLGIGNRYSIVSCIYFVPYILLELPSNLVLRTLGVRKFLSFLVVAWGATQLGMAFVTSWKYLCLCRALLGTFEAGFFPALVFLVSTWYTRREMQKRLAAFYTVSVLIGGFSAIIAYLLSLLDGKGGVAGWSWIFIIEGAITILLGVLAWLYIPEFPDKNTFLTQDQTKLVLDRINQDRGDSLPDKMTGSKIIKHLCDWKIWVFGLMLMCAAVPAYSVAFFITIILRSMGYNVTDSLLLSAPPYAVATASILLFAWLSDKYQYRAFFLAVQTVMTLVGLILTGYVKHNGWRYAGLFLTNAGSSGCIPGILAYASTNIVSHSKRAVTTAITVSFSGVGGIFATMVFREVDFPAYTPGVIATILCQLLLLVLLGLLTAHFWIRNKQIRNGHSSLASEVTPTFLYTI